MKIFLGIFALAVALLGTGCVSTGPAKVTDLQPIAVAVSGANAKATVAKAKIKEAQKVAQKLPKSEDTKLLQLRLTEVEQQVTGLQFDLTTARDEIKIATANNKAEIDKANATITSHEKTIKALEKRQQFFPHVASGVAILSVLAWVFGPVLKAPLCGLATGFLPPAGPAFALASQKLVPDWPFRFGAAALVMIGFLILYQLWGAWSWLLHWLI